MEPEPEPEPASGGGGGGAVDYSAYYSGDAATLVEAAIGELLQSFYAPF